MRRIGRVFLLAVLLPVATAGQETRGNINGIVQDSGGVIPGAAVRITNTATSQIQQLVTNSSGYFAKRSSSIRAYTRYALSCKATRP